MAKHYVTFGQQHVHEINGKTLDRNCVAVFETASSNEGREKCFELFGDQFFTDYNEDEWNVNSIDFFPRGYIHID